jgi:hypothetical protein
LSGESSVPKPLDQEGSVSGFCFMPEIDGLLFVEVEGQIRILPRYSGIGSESNGRGGVGSMVCISSSRSRAK